jgi:hypothetical protein
MAGMGDRSRIARSIAAVESESGVGSFRRRSGRVIVGGSPLMVVLCESNLHSILEENP